MRGFGKKNPPPPGEGGGGYEKILLAEGGVEPMGKEI